MKTNVNNKGLRMTRTILRGLRFLLLVSPAIALIVIAYFNNIFFLKNIVDVVIGILGSLYRNNVLWILLGIYVTFMLVGLLLNIVISFIDKKLKKEEDPDERID